MVADTDADICSYDCFLEEGHMTPFLHLMPGQTDLVELCDCCDGGSLSHWLITPAVTSNYTHYIWIIYVNMKLTIYKYVDMQNGQYNFGRNDVRPGLLKVKNEPLSLGPS